MKSFRIGKVLVKSLFKKPATLMYPVIPREWGERTRGQIDIEEKNCILCGICGRKCPTLAIAVDRKEKKWGIERMQCIQCGCCVDVCPKKCLSMNPQYTEPAPEKVIYTVDVPLPDKKPKPAPKPTPKPDAEKSVAKEGDAQAKTTPAEVGPEA